MDVVGNKEWGAKLLPPINLRQEDGEVKDKPIMSHKNYTV